MNHELDRYFTATKFYCPLDGITIFVRSYHFHFHAFSFIFIFHFCVIFGGGGRPLPGVEIHAMYNGQGAFLCGFFQSNLHN